MSVKNQNITTNSIYMYSDETAHFDLSHQALHCLQRYLVWSVRLKGLIYRDVWELIYMQNILIQTKCGFCTRESFSKQLPWGLILKVTNKLKCKPLMESCGFISSCRYGQLLLIVTFYRLQCFCVQAAKVMIRLRIRAVWTWPSLSAWPRDTF